MAEEAKAAAAADSVKPVDDTTKPADTPADSAAAEEKQSSGSDAAASEDASKGEFDQRCPHRLIADVIAL
jgi:hypothetical protein